MGLRTRSYAAWHRLYTVRVLDLTSLQFVAERSGANLSTIEAAPSQEGWR